MNNKKVVSAVIISIILIVLVLLSIRQHKSQKPVLTPEITLVYAENQVEKVPMNSHVSLMRKLMDELRLLLNVMENLEMKSLLLNSLSLVELTFQEFQ